MPLITPSYFIGDLNVPNVGTGQDIDNTLNLYIKQYEVQFLRNALGQKLYKVLVTALGLGADGAYAKVGVDGKADNTVEGRIVDLFNGKEYTDVSGDARYWPGILNVLDGTQTSKRSPIANYVFFYFMRDQITQATAFGPVVANAENASPACSRPYLAKVWNKMAAWFDELYDFLSNNMAVYPEWTTLDGYQALRSFGFCRPLGGKTIGINPYF